MNKFDDVYMSFENEIRKNNSIAQKTFDFAIIVLKFDIFEICVKHTSKFD